MRTKDVEKMLMDFALRMAGELWTTIALPVVALGLLGRWLDRGFGTKPYLLVEGLLLAGLLSFVSICHKAIGYGQEYRELTEADDENSQEAKERVDAGRSVAYSSGVRAEQKRWPSWRDTERGPPEDTSYG